MPDDRSRIPVLVSLVLAASAFVAGAGDVRAQGELEKTPWATTMVYPVGDPLDFQRPAPGENKGFALSRGLKARGDKHEGLDLTNRAAGGEVRAVAPGLVVTTRTGWGGGWGNMVVLAHRLPGGDLLFSLFAHLLPGSIAVREGEVVALGQPLGKIGSTGHSSGPHLHLEFREMAGKNPLEQPLAMAWMKATIVDPLRVLSTMMPSPSGNPFLAALPAAANAPAGGDPVLALVQRGALPPVAFEHPDDGLTRGELYRMAYSALAAKGEAVPARWTKLRPRLLKKSAALPAAARAEFAAARLPAREAQASAPAALSEVVAVFTALERAGRSTPRGAAIVTAAADRKMLDERFPHGLAALEQAPAPAFTPAATTARTIGPPSVSRRQAALLWAYLESGRAPSAGSAAAAELP
jgi:hypothetical protein